jgi:hypothetical protein
MFEWPPSFQALFVWSTAAAALGGLVKFLYALGRGYIRNNKHLRKALLEVVGGAVVGSLVSLIFTTIGPELRLFVSFAVGLAWAEISQVVRRRITAIVEAALGNVELKAKSEGRGDKRATTPDENASGPATEEGK